MSVKGGLKGAVIFGSQEVVRSAEMPPPFQVDDLSENELEQIRRFIEEGDELSDEMHALVEKYWPWILRDAPPRVTH